MKEATEKINMLIRVAFGAVIAVPVLIMLAIIVLLEPDNPNGYDEIEY